MLIRELELEGLLSFRDARITLGNLNVLIGPNGAGKSNLIETIGLLRATALGFSPYILQGGGAGAWVWKGARRETASATCRLIDPRERFELEYILRFGGQNVPIVSEEQFQIVVQGSDPKLVFHRQGEELRFGHVFSSVPDQGTGLPATESVLSLYKHPADPTPITRFAQSLSGIRIYRGLRTGKSDPIRQGIGAAEGGHLDESGQNLSLVLHEFFVAGKLDAVDQYLHELGGTYRRIKPRYVSGSWTVQLDEEGLLDPVPSPRISDGTLKFICMLAVLMDPKPPPLVCIEEPEIGLHPDAIHVVARAMIEASERTQLVITTHAERLVDALTSRPDAVIVFEKDADNATQMRRLSSEALSEWLDRYSLAELWRKGEIGGTRW